MWKVSIILLLGFACLYVGSTMRESNAYWESVGPSWDKMLNPCKYEPCK